MITTKIIFDRRGWCKQKKKGIVEVRVTIDRKSIYISTGVHINKNEWATTAWPLSMKKYAKV